MAFYLDEIKFKAHADVCAKKTGPIHTLHSNLFRGAFDENSSAVVNRPNIYEKSRAISNNRHYLLTLILRC